MRIMSKVCAEFHSKSGEVLFRVTPDKLYALTDAPESIRQDPLFNLLIEDRTLEVVEKKADQKRLENDPDKPEKPERPAKSGKSAKAEKPAETANARAVSPAEPGTARAEETPAEPGLKA